MFREILNSIWSVNSGTHTFYPDATISNIGQSFTVSAGTISFQTNGSFDMNVFTLSGGTAEFAGGEDVTVASFTQNGGILSGDWTEECQCPTAKVVVPGVYERTE